MCSGLDVADIFMAKRSYIWFIRRRHQNLTKGFVGVLVLGEDLGGHHVMIPQVGDGSSGRDFRNVRFGSRINWRNKHNIGSCGVNGW